MTIVKLLSLQIKVQMVRVSKWLKGHVDCFAMHQVILLEEPITECLLNTVSLRPVSVLLDPIIAQAVLGTKKLKSVFPPLSDRAAFMQKGYTLDPPAIAKEIRRLLFDGKVKMSRMDVCRGEGDKLGFSPALHSNIINSLSEGTRSMLQEYRTARVSSEICSHAAGGSHHPDTVKCIQLAMDNSELQKQNASLQRRIRSAEGRAAQCQKRIGASEEETKEHKAELDKANKKLETEKRIGRKFKKKFYRLRHRMRSQPDLGLDGRKLVEVQNICMDPNRQREEWEKRKRDPSLAFEFAWIKIQGTKEPRPSGGVQWNVEACYQEYENFARSGMEAARRAAYLRESALHGRTMRVFIMPVARKGYCRRNELFTSTQKKERAATVKAAKKAVKAVRAAKARNAGVEPGEGVSAERRLAEDDENDEMSVEEATDGAQPLVRLLDCPSRRTTYQKIIPTCQLLFSCTVSAMLYDASTVRVGLCCDFAKSKGFSCMGAVLLIYQVEKVFEDPVGGVQYNTRLRVCKLPMAQSTNKLTRELSGRDGRSLTPEAAKCLAKSLIVGNAARHFIEHPEMWVIAPDGGYENCGFGLDAREHFCGVGGIYWELVISGRAWPEAVNGAQKAGLLDALNDLFGNSGFSWPQAPHPSVPDRLDTSGPVYKDPKIVQELLGLYADQTRVAKAEARAKKLADLTEAAVRPKPNRPVYGPFQKGGEEAALARESKFQQILWSRRKRALLLYQDRIRSLDDRQQCTDPPVSMEHNPLRFFPCRCTCNGDPLGEVRHCAMHRIHNLTDLFLKPLNEGFLAQCVSATKYAGSEYHWYDFRSAINFMLVPDLHEEIQGTSGFYKAVMDLLVEVMELQTLIEQCAFDVKKGAQPPVTAGLARWGTALGAAAYADRNAPLLAMAIIKRCSLGLEETKTRACADVLSGGFVSKNYANLQIECHAVRHFAFFTTPSDLLQLAIASFVNDVVEMPLLAAVSSDHECGLAAMGAESAIRAIVFAVTRDIWVRCFARVDSGLGWNRKTTLMFRSSGAEFNPEASVLLLNRRCEARVKRRFGDFVFLHPRLVEKASKAVSRLVGTIEQLARRQGPMLPEDSLKRWAESKSKAADLIASCPGQDASARHRQLYEGHDTYGSRVSQAQWLVRQVVQSCAEAICRPQRGMHRELFGVPGWIANMGKTRLTNDVLRIQKPGGGIIESKLVIPDSLALANAVNAFIQARDVMAHYEGKGTSKEKLVKCLPTYCRWWQDADQIRGYINQLRSEGLDSQDGPNVIDSSGAVDSDFIFPKPLSCFPEPNTCSIEAAACICTGKPVESSFSPMKVVGRSKGQAGFALLSMIYRRHNFVTAGLDSKEIITRDKALYWKALDVAMLRGWDWVHVRDDVLGDIFKDAALEDDLQTKNKRVAQGGEL